MPLYDDTNDDGFGSFALDGGYLHGREYLNRAADAATEALLRLAMDSDGDGEDISAEFAPVSHDDVPFNDSESQLDGLLQDDRVAAIVERYSISPEEFGHDFTLTRNNHGAGFWDRGYDDDYLTEMAHGCGEAAVYFTRDDDGDITELYFTV